MDMPLSPIMEDYIEAIYQLLNTEKIARVTDIAKKMNVTMATVTSALRKLASKELIIYSPYKTVFLTDNGETIAKKIAMRHEVLGDFFQSVLSISPKTAMENACRIEHQIDDILFERLIQFVEFIRSCPNMNIKWHDELGFKCADLQTITKKCIDCNNKTISNGDLTMITTTNLAQLNPGDKARVVTVQSDSATASRMAEMGVIEGTIIEIQTVAPMGDPIDIKLKGYHLSLRKKDAQHISVEKL